MLLEFDGTEQTSQVQDELVFFLSEFLKQRKCFTGTATELAEELDRFAGELYKPNVLMKKLLRCQQELLDLWITLSTRRPHDCGELTLCVSNDGKNDTGPVSDLPSQPSQEKLAHPE